MTLNENITLTTENPKQKIAETVKMLVTKHNARVSGKTTVIGHVNKTEWRVLFEKISPTTLTFTVITNNNALKKIIQQEITSCI